MEKMGHNMSNTQIRNKDINKKNKKSLDITVPYHVKFE